MVRARLGIDAITTGNLRDIPVDGQSIFIAELTRKTEPGLARKPICRFICPQMNTVFSSLTVQNPIEDKLVATLF